LDAGRNVQSIERERAARVGTMPVDGAALVHREHALRVSEQDMLRGERELCCQPAEAPDGALGQRRRGVTQRAMILALPEIENAVHEGAALADQLLPVETRRGLGCGLRDRRGTLDRLSLCVDLRHGRKSPSLRVYRCSGQEAARLARAG